MSSDTILIAASDETIHQAIKDALEKHYVLVYAKHGFEAVRIADSRRPALVIIDIDITGLSGIDFCRRMKATKHTKDIPVILLSSHADKEDVIFGLQAGADDYLTKPINPAEVLVRVDAHLNYTKFLDDLEPEDLKLLLELSNSISVLRNPMKILQQVVEKVADLVGVERCSIVSINNANEFTVKASNDLEGQEEIKLDLDGYPEIRKAFETRSAVVVNDTTLDPLMDSVRAQIKKRGLNSIFVVPIIKKESVIGSLFLGTATKLQDGISDRVYKLCHLIANISANALENAVLFESMATAKEVFEDVVIRDNLTRLFTHKHFYTQLEKEFSRTIRYKLTLSLILFNIDDFRRINSKYGHMIGDEVLKKVGQLIRSIVRDIDVAARYSGDEFALLLPNTDKEGATILAQRLNTLISESDYEVIGKENVTISVGVSSFTGDGSQTLDQLVEGAKKSMMKAKSSGSGHIMVQGQT
jgi:two-component system cell cycle response regulator